MKGQDGGKGKRSFVFYHEWAELLADQPDKVRLAVFDAAISYSRTGELPRLSTVASMAFKFIKADMDRDKEKYDEVCKRRSEAGKKGMRNRWSKNNECITNDNKNNNVINVITPITNITDNDNDNDDEDEDDNDDDDDSTRINTSERAKYKGALSRKKPTLQEIVAKQQREAEEQRRFELTLYQRDDVQAVKTDIPTEEEVFEHMCTCTNGTLANAREEARKFVNHYNANGWMMGTAPVRSWEAAVENWIDNIKNYGNRQQQANEEGRRNFIAAIRGVEERARYEQEHGEEELPF